MSTYDIVNGLKAKPRLQIDHQKVCIFWDTNLGASEEALVDAYIEAHGLNTAHKYGINLSISANTDRDLLWDSWLSDVADYIEKHQIQAICCSPNCPLTQNFIQAGNESLTAFSTLLSSSVSIKKILQIENIPIATLLTTKFFDQAIKNLTVKTLDNVEDVYYTQDGGLLRDDLPINEFGFNIDGIDRLDFRTDGRSTPRLWLTDFNAVQGLTGIDPKNPHNGAAILKIPSWRIGWKASGLMPSPTPQEITNMVNRGKAAGALSFEDHKAQSKISMTLRDRTSEGHCGKGVALGKALDSIGYANYNYGFRTTHSNTLATIPAVNDPSLAHFKKLDPISNQTDSRFVATNTPVLDAEPDPVNSSVVRYYSDASTSPGDKGMRFDAYNNATFPLECFIHFSLFGNFETDNNLEFYNSATPNSQTIEVQDGGCVVELTSHGHKISPMALRHGASAAFCSYVEPGGTSAIMKSERFIFSLLRGNSYALAAMRTRDDWTDEHELWGDGLATPYREQSNEITPETKKMKSIFNQLFNTKNPSDTSYVWTSPNTYGAASIKNQIENSPFGMPNNTFDSDTIIFDYVYEITNAGSGFTANEIMILDSSTGSGNGQVWWSSVNSGTGGAVSQITSFRFGQNQGAIGKDVVDGEVLTFSSASGGSGCQVTVRAVFTSRLDLGVSSGLGAVSITYISNSSDTPETICDYFVNAVNTNAQLKNQFSAYKTFGTNGSFDGRPILRCVPLSSLASDNTFTTNLAVTASQPNSTFVKIPMRTAEGVYAANQDLVAMPTDRDGRSQRTETGELIFQNTMLNIDPSDFASSGLSGFLTPTPSASLFGLIIFPENSVDSVNILGQAGTQPKIQKITYKNTQRPDLTDIVILKTDLDPWQLIASVYLITTLNSNSGAARRTLPLIKGDKYEMTIEFSAKDLGLSGNKRLVKRGFVNV